MRVGIFYLSLNASSDRQALHLPNGGHVFVRIVEVECDDLSNALAAAKPRRDEMVMNTHPLEKRS